MTSSLRDNLMSSRSPLQNRFSCSNGQCNHRDRMKLHITALTKLDVLRMTWWRRSRFLLRSDVYSNLVTILQSTVTNTIAHLTAEESHPFTHVLAFDLVGWRITPVTTTKTMTEESALDHLPERRGQVSLHICDPPTSAQYAYKDCICGPWLRMKRDKACLREQKQLV